LKIQSGKDSIVKKLVNGVEYLLKGYGVTVVKGSAQLVAPGKALCAGETYCANSTLIATGSQTVVPPIPGAEENAVGSTQALSLKKIPARLAVIGGGVIGLEIASAYRAFGSEVIVLEMLDSLMVNEDADAVKELSNLLKSKGIDIRTGAVVQCIEKRGDSKIVRYTDASGNHEYVADIVLTATGRKACLKGIDAVKLGLKLDNHGNICVDKYMQTNLKGVYAAGDVVGGWQLAHSAYAEAEAAVDNIFGEVRKVCLETMPRCVYTLPPYAAVGITKQQAESQGIPYSVGRFPYSANGMALVEDAPEGTARVLVEKGTDKILGVQIVGAGATELISTAAMAVSARVTVGQWAHMITAHPSLSEILHEAVLDNAGLSLHSPVKRR